MYLAVSTRPDIAYTVRALSQFNVRHGMELWNAAKRVLRYLKSTSNYGLTFKKTGKDLVGYVDADWAGCPDDRRSYTGYAFIFGNAAVSWEAKKQRTVALSSTESEYMAMAEGAKEAIYLQNLLEEFGIQKRSTVLYNDNQGAQALVKNPIFHARTKHIDVRHHFVRDAFESKLIEPTFLRTEEMPADILTKSLFGRKHYNCIRMLNVNEHDASLNTKKLKFAKQTVKWFRETTSYRIQNLPTLSGSFRRRGTTPTTGHSSGFACRSVIFQTKSQQR